MVELEFSPVEPKIADNLEATPHFGGLPKETIQGEVESFKARVHENPIAISLRDLLTKNKFKLAAKLYDRFDLWMVPHRFSVVRLGGGSILTRVGCEIDYLSSGTTFSIISLVPSTEFIRPATAALEAEAKVNVSIGELGIAELVAEAFSDHIIEHVPGSNQTTSTIKVVGGAHVNLSMTICTPFISAVGVGSSSCMFHFTAHQEPLYDRDIETWAIVAIPKYAEDISYKMRCSYTSRRIFASRTSQTAWLEVRAAKAS